MNEEELLLSYLVLQKQLTEEQALFCFEESFREKGTLLEILTQQKLISLDQIQNSQQWLQKTLNVPSSLAEESQEIANERAVLIQKLEQISKKNSEPSTSKTLTFFARSENLDTTIAPPSSCSPQVISPENPVQSADHLSLNERYHLIENLGEGGMGVVQRVYDRWLEREVALKKIKLEEGSTAPLSKKQTALLWRLTREASITAILEHPNIVPLYDMQRGTHGETYFTMRKIEGSTLRELLQKTEKEPSPLEESNRLLAIFLKVCDAVSYAHSKGIIHRDLKPENIMVGEFGEVYVMDWGIAKKQLEPKEKEPLLHKINEKQKTPNQTIGGLGTEGYMAPEQRENASQVLPTADIYALGKILRECFTRKSPLEELWFYMKIQSQKHTTEKKASTLQKSFPIIPKDVEAIVAKATQEKPQNRYESVQALAKDVSCYLGHFQVSARSYHWSEQILKWIARNWKALSLSILTLLLCLIVGVAVTWWQKEEAIQARFNEAEARKNAEQKQKLAEIAQQESFLARKEVEHRLVLSKIQNLIFTAQSCLEQNQDEKGALLTIQAYFLNERYQGTFHLLLDQLFRRVLTKKAFRHFLPGDTVSLLSCQFSSDGNWVAYGGTDGRLYLWDQSNPYLEPQALLLPQNTNIRFIQFSPDTEWIAVGTYQGSIFLFRMKDLQHPPVYLQEENNPINSVVFTPESRYLISGSGNQYPVLLSEEKKTSKIALGENALLIWDLHRLYLGPFFLGSHKKAITSVVFDPTRQWIISGSWDNTIQIWDYQTLRLDNPIRPIQNVSLFDKSSHTSNILAISLEGRFLASGGRSGEIYLWDLKQETQVPILLEGHQKEIKALCFLPDSSQLISGSLDQSIRIWNLQSYREVETIPTKRNIQQLSLSPDGKKLLGATERELSFWELQSKQTHFLSAEISPINALDIQKEKKQLISASGGLLKFWNLESKESLTPTEVSTSYQQIFALSVSPDEKEFAFSGQSLGAEESYITVCKEEMKSLTALKTKSEIPISALAYHPTLPILASLGIDGTVLLWDLKTLQLQKQWKKVKQTEFPVLSLSFSADGKYLAVAGSGYIQVWNIETEEAFWLKGKHEKILYAVFHPKKMALATCSWNGEIEYWKSIFDESPVTFGVGSEEVLTAIAFHPHQEFLAVGGINGEISFWDLANLKEPVGMISAHQANVNKLMFNKEGTLLFSAGKDGKLSQWNFSLKDLCASLQKKVKRNLTFEEWRQYLKEDFSYELLCPEAPIHSSMKEAVKKELSFSKQLALFHPTLQKEAEKKIATWERNQKTEAEIFMWKKWSSYWKQSLQEHLLPILKQDPQNLTDGEWKIFLKELQEFTQGDPDIEKGLAFIRARWICHEKFSVVEQALFEEEYTEAQKLLKEILQLNPSLPFDLEKDFLYWATKILIRKGLSAAQSGDIPMALQMYEKAQKLEPEVITSDQWGYLCLFGVAYHQGKEVLFAGEQALSKNPNKALFWEIRGMAQVLSGNFPDAISDFEKFIAIASSEGNVPALLLAKNTTWIESLKEGKNPFTEEEEPLKNICFLLLSLDY